MSRKRTAEVLAAVMQAFLEEGTWKQADLARRANTSTEVIRKTLEELRASGWPLERDEEPPQVYWSMPPGWLPNGIVLPKDEVGALLRLLARMPGDDERDRIVAFLTKAAPRVAQPDLTAWMTPRVRPQQMQFLQQVEDSIRDRQALQVRYLSSSRGTLESRGISVQRITSGPPIRLCGHCHRDERLKWFRLDNVVEVEGPWSGPWVEVPEAEINAFVASTVNGFFSESDADTSTFFVRLPEARWVQHNLPRPMSAESVEGGIRVHVERASLQQVARYVVSLGAAARPESESLREAVRALAEGVLASVRQDT